MAQDPGFLLAWERVSEAASIRYADAVPTPEVAARAKEAAEKAVALAPDRPEGYLALGTYLRLVRDDPKRALGQFAEGQRLAPGNADLLRGTALCEQVLGRWESAVEHFRAGGAPGSTVGQRLDSDRVRFASYAALFRGTRSSGTGAWSRRPICV